MSYPFTPPSVADAAPEQLVLDAVRCWRTATNRRQPVLPTLFARLDMQQAGFLAPAINALLSLHEAWLGRRFSAGDPAAPNLTEDERRLLVQLDGGPLLATADVAKPGLTAPLRAALHSTRIMMRRVRGHDTGQSL